MSDVVNCHSIMTCSGCVREDCWWLVFKNYTEQCSPVLAGVPNVHEWFYGPGSCRQFHCVDDEWDVYGLLQLLGGGAGGALLGGGLVWNFLRRGYGRLRDANQPTARWRRILDWTVRIFRVIDNHRRDGQNAGRGDGGQHGAAQVVDRDARIVNIAPLDQVAPGAVNVDIGQLLRHQEDELQNLEGLIRQRNEELEEIRRQIGRQQQQQQQPPVQDDEEESEAENENGGQHNIPTGENDTPQQGHQAIDRAGAPGSRIPPLMIPQREESSSSCESSERVNTDSSTVQRRNSPRPTASSQLQASRRLSMGLPSTPTSSQAEGRQPRSAAQISERKTKILAKNKLI